VTAVAVWDKHPTTDDLLDYRISRGWHPTPSRLKEGDEVMGHAACVIK